MHSSSGHGAVPVLHSGRLFVPQGLKDTRALSLRHGRHAMSLGADDDQMGLHMEPRGGFLQFGQNQKRQQKRADHVDRDGRFVIFVLPIGRGDDAGIFDQHVQSLQRVHPPGEIFHGLVAGEIERPDMHHVEALRALLDRSFGLLALLEVPHAQDDRRGVEAGEVPGRFQPEADVGARHDDGLTGEVLGRIRRGDEELVFDEAEESHVRECGSSGLRLTRRLMKMMHLVLITCDP